MEGKIPLKKIPSYLTPLRPLSPSRCLFHKKEIKAISKKDRGSQQETNKKPTNKQETNQPTSKPTNQPTNKQTNKSNRNIRKSNKTEN
ncbi:hypothetical protein EO98_18245 [Methanosarcina sp. 2.H.T.1A.6]|nr:hypothetical protein EO94_18650 [Methanosarcina sp. 2.H.T.1A.3]KKG20274.1 hypothetical protein EO98_18245 [Methanosarcina sp. 2.H.T.1A.6]KKG23463.1 hypothetical protein EO96_17615 [Methanosarcina sp. 2.H.T.1A.8]KKG29563.1 hypothetical protein EO97_17725 [Methanosarcina sp. 2.H.T.1A.15]